MQYWWTWKVNLDSDLDGILLFELSDMFVVNVVWKSAKLSEWTKRVSIELFETNICILYFVEVQLDYDPTYSFRGLLEDSGSVSLIILIYFQWWFEFRKKVRLQLEVQLNPSTVQLTWVVKTQWSHRELIRLFCLHSHRKFRINQIW